VRPRPAPPNAFLTIEITAQTISTLNFAKRAKTIKNVVRVNEQLSADEMAAMIRVLQRDLDAARKELQVYKRGGAPVPRADGAADDGVVFDSVAYAQLRVEYNDLKSRFVSAGHHSRLVLSQKLVGAG
jgi:hypothetical protein